jgi:hypothetical protein
MTVTFQFISRYILYQQEQRFVWLDDVSEVHTASIIGAMTHSLWNFCQLVRDYKAQYPTRQLSAYSQQWDPEISRVRLPRHVMITDIQSIINQDAMQTEHGFAT